MFFFSFFGALEALGVWGFFQPSTGFRGVRGAGKTRCASLFFPGPFPASSVLTRCLLGMASAHFATTGSGTTLARGDRSKHHSRLRRVLRSASARKSKSPAFSLHGQRSRAARGGRDASARRFADARVPTWVGAAWPAQFQPDGRCPQLLLPQQTGYCRAAAAPKGSSSFPLVAEACGAWGCQNVKVWKGLAALNFNHSCNSSASLSDARMRGPSCIGWPRTRPPSGPFSCFGQLRNARAPFHPGIYSLPKNHLKNRGRQYGDYLFFFWGGDSEASSGDSACGRVQFLLLRADERA